MVFRLFLVGIAVSGLTIALECGKHAGIYVVLDGMREMCVKLFIYIKFQTIAIVQHMLYVCVRT